MSPSDKALCDEWAAILRYWVDTAVSSLESGANKEWALNREAFERLRPILGQAKPEDIAALLGGFGAGLLHSLLVSFEQGPIHVQGSPLAIIDKASDAQLSPGLNETFMSAAFDAGLIK